MPHYDVRRVKNGIMQIRYVLIWLKCFFSKDDLAVIVACCTEKKTISIKSTNRVYIIYIIRFLTHLTS